MQGFLACLAVVCGSRRSTGPLTCPCADEIAALEADISRARQSSGALKQTLAERGSQVRVCTRVGMQANSASQTRGPCVRNGGGGCSSRYSLSLSLSGCPLLRVPLAIRHLLRSSTEHPPSLAPFHGCGILEAVSSVGATCSGQGGNQIGLTANVLRTSQDTGSRDTSRNGSRRNSRMSSPVPTANRPMLPEVALSPDGLVAPAKRGLLQPARDTASPPGAASLLGGSGEANGHAATQSDAVAADQALPQPRLLQASASGERPAAPPGGLDVSTIKSLKETIESLLRDLNKAITERDAAVKEKERLENAVKEAQGDDSHVGFLRQEVQSLRDNKSNLEDALRENVRAHQTELQELRQRFVAEMERSEQEKTAAISDIEQSYSEALRAAQSRTTDARAQSKQTQDKVEELTREVEGMRTQLRQVEADRSFQVTCLEDERRQFNKFREEALRKHTDLSDTSQTYERRVADLEAKVRAANLEAAADKQERGRALDKLREELEGVMQARDAARTNASALRRSLDTANEEVEEGRRAADKLQAQVKELAAAKDRAEQAAEAIKDKLAMVEKMRGQELEDLAEIQRSLVSQQKEREAVQQRATERLTRALEPRATRHAAPPLAHEQDTTAAAPLPPAAAAGHDAADRPDAPQTRVAEPVSVGAPSLGPHAHAHAHAHAAHLDLVPPETLPVSVKYPPPAPAAASTTSAHKSASASTRAPAPEQQAEPVASPRRSVATRAAAPAAAAPPPQDAQVDAPASSPALPPALAGDEGALEDICLEAPVRALADIYVVSARDVPRDLGQRPLRVHIRLGWPLPAALHRHTPHATRHIHRSPISVHV